MMMACQTETKQGHGAELKRKVASGYMFRIPRDHFLWMTDCVAEQESFSCSGFRAFPFSSFLVTLPGSAIVGATTIYADHSQRLPKCWDCRNVEGVYSSLANILLYSVLKCSPRHAGNPHGCD